MKRADSFCDGLVLLRFVQNSETFFQNSQNQSEQCYASQCDLFTYALMTIFATDKKVKAAYLREVLLACE